MKAKFVDPMLLLTTDQLPAGDQWSYEIKLHGYRALAIKSGGKVQLRSRNNNDFNKRYPAIVDALVGLPDETVVDAEVVALNTNGKPSFNILQDFGSGTAPLYFYIFDLLILGGKDIMSRPLVERRQLLETRILPKLTEPIRYSPILLAPLSDLIESVKAQGLEGLVAKRNDSKYEPGLRSGAWQKMRINRGQEFVIAGYTASPKNFDAPVIGYFDGPKLMYAARTRNGFTPASRAELFKKVKPLEIKDCPFANLPEQHAGRWGAGLTLKKMADCRWLKPQIVGQFEFVEWTSDKTCASYCTSFSIA